MRKTGKENDFVVSFGRCRGRMGMPSQDHARDLRQRRQEVASVTLAGVTRPRLMQRARHRHSPMFSTLGFPKKRSLSGVSDFQGVIVSALRKANDKHASIKGPISVPVSRSIAVKCCPWLGSVELR